MTEENGKTKVIQFVHQAYIDVFYILHTSKVLQFLHYLTEPSEARLVEDQDTNLWWDHGRNHDEREAG